MSDIPMDSLERHRAFAQGTLVTPDMERAKIEAAAVEEAKEKYRPLENIGRTLNKAEKQDLAEIVGLPGWEVVRRIVERAYENHQKRAIALSQQKPLENAQAISEAWAYTEMFRQAHREMFVTIDQELETLKGKKK